MKVAVVGATGAVGRELLLLLEERGFPLEDLRVLASSRSAGKRLRFRDRELSVEALAAGSLSGIDFAFFSAGAGASREHAPAAAEEGTIVIDNSSAFRMDDGIPLVVPEVNPEALSAIRPGEGKARAGVLLANPNCSTILMVMAVHPLRNLARVERIVISTYQAMSGAGAAAMAELQRQTRQVLSGEPPSVELFSEPCAFNLFSHDSPIASDGSNVEELKLIREARKIWNEPALCITPTCVRVPVLRAHAAAVNLQFERPVSAEEARQALERAPGIEVIDDRKGNRFPTPLKASHRDEVLVGRIREDPGHPRGLNLFLCGDQLRKGAALNAIQIAERLLEGRP